MDWPTILSIAAVNIGLITWLRSDQHAFFLEVRAWKDEINKEMKDFHGRLCALEEKTKHEKNNNH